MALVAVHAVIDIPADIRVLEVGCVAAAMATRALKNGVVVRIGVAGGAHAVGIAVIHGKPGMVESGSRPRRGGMAGCARRREHGRGRGVNRVRGRRVIRFMAAVTIGGERRVIVVHMAIRAGHRRVRASEREGRGAVIEGAIRPQCGVVAELAGRWEAYLNMVYRRSRVVVVIQVARDASRVGAGQAVVIVDMTVGAYPRRNRVRIGQSKSRRGVIEFAIRPEHRVVATFTSRRETGLDVIYRGRRGVVVVEVARNASRRRQIVVVVDVAIGAGPWWIGVRVRQGEPDGSVIESCRLPSNRSVTGLAGLRKSSGDVIWIRRALKILQVATRAGGAGQVVVVIDMAIGADARRIGVRIRQWEPEGTVVESRRLPGNRSVAGLAGLRKSSGDVIWIRRALEILQVATRAGGAC